MRQVYAIWVLIGCAMLWHGLPFWPLMMGTAFALVVAFYLEGENWLVPLSAFFAYVALRFIVNLPPLEAMLVTGPLWIGVGAFIAYNGKYLVGLCYLCSGAVYPVAALFGLQVTYLGPVAIASHMFAIAALALMGGGMSGNLIPRTPRDSRGAIRLGVPSPLGSAQSDKRL